jgi:endonuclease YncB( thermonuclease family)
MKSMFCCFFKKSSKEPIEWSHTKPFVPPIDQGQVIKVYDGDTITIAAKLPYKSSPLYRFQVRLIDIDTPEMKGKTQEEKEAAHRAKKALEELVLHKPVYLKDCGHEKYGRLLANVYVDVPYQGRIHINRWMLDQGYAVPYNGGTKKEFIPL